MDPTDTEHVDERAAATPHPSRERSQRRAAYAEWLEERLRSLRDALRAARQGDFSVRLPTNGTGDGVLGEVALAFNALVEENEALVEELDRVSRVVGMEGQ